MYISRDIRFVEAQMFYATTNQGEIFTYDDFQVAYPLEINYEIGQDSSISKHVLQEVNVEEHLPSEHSPLEITTSPVQN
jgi:hypothetical protein